MPSPRPIGSTDGPFRRIVKQVREFDWYRGLEVTEIAAPQRLAPEALALEATLETPRSDATSGRLVVLHDPSGNESWGGNQRIVTFVGSDIDSEMITDPLLAEVGWSWLREALDRNECHYHAESGTVTTMSGRGFGNKANEPILAEIEIRASWTPEFTGPIDIRPHLSAWQELLCLVAGVPSASEDLLLFTPRSESGLIG